MSAPADWASGKGHRDENFPVASWLVAPRHRFAIMAFYRFARAADDAADHPELLKPEKLDLLDRLEATLLGDADAAEAIALRDVIEERRLSARHPLDLLRAFRLDTEKTRYASFDELMGYCALSAMPVGRFVLDVHGEAPATWEASDALCAALQIINHLQDCGADYRDLGRVYIPLDTLAAHGAAVEDLGRERASAELRRAIAELAEETRELLRRSSRLASEVRDWRLCMEIAAIQRLAERLAERLTCRDPLSERVHLGKKFMLLVTLGAVMGEAGARLDPVRAFRRLGRARP